MWNDVVAMKEIAMKALFQTVDLNAVLVNHARNVDLLFVFVVMFGFLFIMELCAWIVISGRL
jgi:hypothetical protein